MPLLNTEDGLQKARQALMDNLKSNGCQTRPSGDQNDAGEETTIFTRGDLCVELSSKGGLFVRPLNNDGGQLGVYLGAGFGGRHSWQMAQENGGFILCHTLSASGETAQTVIDVVDDEFDQITIDDRTFFKICSTYDDDAFERITRFGLLCYQAGQPEEPGNPPPPTGGCDPGPSGGGKKSAATWSAKHSPYVNKIMSALDELGWNQVVDGWPWQPDLLRGSLNSDKRILIEVKPNSGTHNVITAIGQVICYSSGMKNVIKVIAIPWSNSLPPHMTNVLKTNDIKILDLDKADLQPLLEMIIQ
jgi:hypothetical protein